MKNNPKVHLKNKPNITKRWFIENKLRLFIIIALPYVSWMPLMDSVGIAQTMDWVCVNIMGGYKSIKRKRIGGYFSPKGVFQLLYINECMMR